MSPPFRPNTCYLNFAKITTTLYPPVQFLLLSVPDGAASQSGQLNKWSQCQFCKVVITTVNLWRHIRTQHTPQPQRQCDHCRKKFKNKYSLREHVRIAHELKVTTSNAPTTVDTIKEQFATALTATEVVPSSAGNSSTSGVLYKSMASIKTMATFPPSMY